ncbi:RagB/SusD family nutrient uptake outer membrane protein [Capnocytophaga sp. oral taxon 878]|uniref:RagB/SusD family nutrient uptake outer membrane protein n=1 Tax=Capnocytophaga sp. oral taxon 878 TaxID=1316596 RepID=UPI000D044896|nr:RagB/SusD family nutrient uptake outer membrane protein [Capnocytophaga sp. oral taxon 878]AVM51057.1 RagB/SusD family nutrient uptake outer membrane protein [Capnocytophaga sp. oral taxon 878]
MKVFKYIQGNFLRLLLVAMIALANVRCSDYLDVVPPEQAGLPDATKDYDSTLKFLYSCYAGIASPYYYSTLEGASDEYVLPPLWNEGMHRILQNTNAPGSVADGWRWGNNYYKFIGQCYLFLSQIDNAREVTDAQKKQWKAEANFMIAYYHMMLLCTYGPCPIQDSFTPMNTDAKEYKGRYHFDYVVNWVVNKFDEVAADLPAKQENENWGRATSTIAKALKARLLVYAASPLWNGSFPYPNWKNTNFETPGYGYELVSKTYDASKWQRAKVACQEALDYAMGEGGCSLFTDEEMYTRGNIDLPYVPGVDKNTPEGKAFLKKVMLMRYLTVSRYSEGNHEIVWPSADQGNFIYGQVPHHVFTRTNKQNVGYYSGVSPVLNTSIHYFYTKNGKRPANDPTFAPESEWYKSAGIANESRDVTNRKDIIKLNVNREPRFYAWFAFDGGDFASKLNQGKPLHIELRNGDKQGYNPVKYQRDNNVTGYFSQKGIMPKLTFDANGGWNYESKPRSLIRLAELYLNLAECEAALGENANAITHLNVIRERAGVPALTAADITGNMTMTEWVRNERFIELWGEGQRYYDIRRWMIAPETMGTNKRLGLNAYGIVNPTFEQFNTVTPIKQPFEWNNRMYLLPIYVNEVYKNPQLIQAPGY